MLDGACMRKSGSSGCLHVLSLSSRRIAREKADGRAGAGAPCVIRRNWHRLEQVTMPQLRLWADLRPSEAGKNQKRTSATQHSIGIIQLMKRTPRINVPGLGRARRSRRPESIGLSAGDRGWAGGHLVGDHHRISISPSSCRSLQRLDALNRRHHRSSCTCQNDAVWGPVTRCSRSLFLSSSR